jgi:uncharacterized protein (TIGR02444 family)
VSAEPAPLALCPYAVTVYGLPGVKEPLLKLQERYRIDVNACLWCIYCGRYGYAFEAADVEIFLDELRELSLYIVHPLRAVRVFLTGPRKGIPLDTTSKLRAEVLQLEIQAEEMVLRRLAALTEAAGEPNPDLQDMQLRAERLFTLVREAMDRPTMIADEDGPLSAAALFAEVCQRAERDGP